MTEPLERGLRSRLEAAVKQARRQAEAGAHAALHELGVADATRPAHLNDAQGRLRVRLRAHGRQLGDRLNGGREQTMTHLVQEVAYQHWHRMLFARFLAENRLLMYDGVAVTLEECEELAADEGARNALKEAQARIEADIRNAIATRAAEASNSLQQTAERLAALGWRDEGPTGARP